MIGAARISHRNQWLQAVAMSLVLHGAAIGGILYERAPAAPTSTATPPVITVDTLLSQGAVPAAPVLTPVVPEVPPEMPQPQDIAALSAPTQAPPARIPADSPAQAPMDSAIVTTGGEMWAVVQPAIPALPPDVPLSGLDDAPPEAPEPALPAEPVGEPLDPRLEGMIQRIRDKLDESCLLALPQLTADGQVRIAVLAAADRQIGAFVDEITEGLGEIPDRRVLLDQRQCPGLTFARRTEDYPLFGLQMQLDAADIDSGNSVTGRIANGAGHYNTLLLVDDNGVVQDLRRFLTVQGGEVGFDVPMSRAGAARDTNQLLIAIATPGRIDSVTRNAGRLAADFFPELIAELGDNVLIGVSSVYVR
ncbi:hypothetical protein PE067_02030 [Paracoccus sp. DMF-8]|uniref:hypothetical protein n=1 Tax=Paracoccus sp. DMF-8 TaxID=3019445 RepID=UPI0023E7567E|nr:hypothetical protein [Paracoccus sp. DMF-8]MDF3605045.1 hypothetical protein [Paracoccus sp. DMF-8]